MTPSFRVTNRPYHEAFADLTPDASMVEILEAISKWMHCYIVCTDGLFHFIPNGEHPSAEYLKASEEAARKFLADRGKGI